MVQFLSEYWSWILTAIGLALWIRGPRPTAEENRAFNRRWWPVPVVFFVVLLCVAAWQGSHR